MLRWRMHVCEVGPHMRNQFHARHVFSPGELYKGCNMLIYSEFLLSLSFYIYIYLCNFTFDKVLLVRKPGLIWLFTGTSPIRIFAALLFQHLLVFHSILLDVPWFLAKIARKIAKSLWIPFGSPTLWFSPLSLDHQSWGLLCRICLLHQLVVLEHLPDIF